jgi:hypothetical protein
MGIYHFPSEFVFWTENEKHTELKDELVEKINKDTQIRKQDTGGLTNAITNYANNEYCQFLNDTTLIKNVVVEPFKEMIKEFNSRMNVNKLNIKNIHVSSTWYTKYKTGGYFPMHSHIEKFGCVIHNNELYQRSFSLIYILNDKNIKNSTEFFVPSACRTSAFNANHYTFKSGDIPDIKEGSIIIFPASLYHQVCPSIEPDRIVISYNIDCTFDGDAMCYIPVKSP